MASRVDRTTASVMILHTSINEAVMFGTCAQHAYPDHGTCAAEVSKFWVTCLLCRPASTVKVEVKSEDVKTEDAEVCCCIFGITLQDGGAFKHTSFMCLA